MASAQSAQARLDRLRGYRNRPEPDLSLAFVATQFKRQIEQPQRHLRQMAAVWQRLVPPELARHTRLAGLQRGTLKVVVDSSPRLFELDRLLRAGLHDQIIREHQGPACRRIKLSVGLV